MLRFITWSGRVKHPLNQNTEEGISSTAGQRGEAGYSNYAAYKGGQISFTKALANELAPFVRVNAVAPVS